MPDILTSDVHADYLTSEAAGAEELGLLIDRAERKVIGRYDDGDEVHLGGWAEDDNADPNLEEMDEDLLDGLRAAIASVVEHWASQPDEAGHVQSMSQGARSVTFRDASRGLPSGTFGPLHRFDETPAWF